MAFQHKQPDDTFKPWAGQRTGDGLIHSRKALAAMTEAQRYAIDLYTETNTPPPVADNQKLTKGGLAFEGGKCVRQYTVATLSNENMRRKVKQERDRRLVLPLAFAGQIFDMDAQSFKRIDGAATLAGFAIGAGKQPGDLRWHDGDTDFAWITATNDIFPMDAHTTFALGKAAAKNESALIFKAAALKGMNPIPSDFADNKYW